MTNAERIQANNAELQECLNLAKNIISGGSGGMELNIAYGDTPPEDTTKLWVKCDTPEAVQVLPPSLVGANAVAAVSSDGEITTLDTKLPGRRTSIVSGTVGTKVYLFGGETSQPTKRYDTVFEFDAKANTITTLSTKLPSVMTDMGSGVVGTKIYLFGGYNGNARLNTILEFDTETQTLTTLSTKLPSVMNSMSTGVVGTKIYLFGGYNGNSYLNTILKFDTETKALTTLSTTTQGVLRSLTVNAVGAKIYIFGGADNNNSGKPADTIQEFDTETNTVTILGAKLPKGAYGMASGAIGAKTYLFGGYAGYEITTIVMFDPDPTFYLPENHALVVANLDKNFFALLPNVVMGVERAYIGNADNESEPIEAALYQDGEWKTI